MGMPSIKYSGSPKTTSSPGSRSHASSNSIPRSRTSRRSIGTGMLIGLTFLFPNPLRLQLTRPPHWIVICKISTAEIEYKKRKEAIKCPIVIIVICLSIWIRNRPKECLPPPAQISSLPPRPTAARIFRQNKLRSRAHLNNKVCEYQKRQKIFH